ncbi:MAG TPA: L-rhamnose/proton symporter RhaT [Acidobacteriaceae bacterium]|nr:L-rhamnose/proton symporter RhaT [Acidobacteriaceae bacterium]
MPFIILGGLMEGLFTLPVKITPKWSWENIWGAGSLCALILVPGPLLLITVPHFQNVYAAAPSAAILWAILFGAGWGLGGIFFGLGVSALGLSLGTSLIMGLVAIGGSVVPLLLQHRDQLFGKSGAALLSGIGIMILGLALCARAGSLKTATGASSKTGSFSPAFSLGLFYCIAAGLLSALVNFALIFGAPIANPAIAQGLDAATANNAVWALVFAANYLVNLGYCFYLGFRKQTLVKFFLPGTGSYWILAMVMGLLWAGGIVVYGRGASMEGIYGPVFGFPIMLIASILTGNFTGAILAEWRGAPARAKRTMQWSVAIMIVAIVTLGCSNYWIP